MQRFWTKDGNWKCAVFPFNLSLHYHIYIFKSLFSCRDDYFENLRETTVLACEMFTFGCRSWLKNVACLSSMFTSDSVKFQSLGQAGDLNHLPLSRSISSPHWLILCHFVGRGSANGPQHELPDEQGWSQRSAVPDGEADWSRCTRMCTRASFL